MQLKDHSILQQEEDAEVYQAADAFSRVHQGNWG